MALVRKILEGNIPSGGSSVTFTDSDIPNSLIRVYSTNNNIYPQNISLAGNTLTVTYEQVTSALGVAVELVKQGLEIDDTLTSDASNHALSALQGKNLKELIDNIPEGKSNISDMNDVDITDIEDGQVLAWNETEKKFVNVNQSGGSAIYSSDEIEIGSYIDGKTIYRKTFYINDTITLGSQYVISHGLTGIDTIINMSGSYFDNADSRMYTLPNLRQTYSEAVYIVSYVPNTHIPILALQSGGYNYGAVSKIRITLEYTKV